MGQKWRLLAGSVFYDSKQPTWLAELEDFCWMLVLVSSPPSNTTMVCPDARLLVKSFWKLLLSIDCVNLSFFFSNQLAS